MAKGFFTLLGRELWEHNALKWMPAGLLLFIFLTNLAFLFAVQQTEVSIASDGASYSFNDMLEQYKGLGEAKGQTLITSSVQSAMAIKGVLLALGMIINSVLQIMMAFYLLDSLHRERKDYSILFWKSLPISDTSIVISKLVVAVVVIPAITLITIALADLMTLSIQSFLLRDTLGAISLLWRQADILQFWYWLLFLLIEQSLWFFPIMGWLLLCSAWSKKSPFVPAFVLPMLLIFIDSSFRLDTGISELLLERSPFGLPSAVGVDGYQEWKSHTGSTVRDTGFSWLTTMMQMNLSGLLDFVLKIKVWMGMIIGVFFTTVAIWIRRWQGDSF